MALECFYSNETYILEKYYMKAARNSIRTVYDEWTTGFRGDHSEQMQDCLKGSTGRRNAHRQQSYSGIN